MILSRLCQSKSYRVHFLDTKGLGLHPQGSGYILQIRPSGSLVDLSLDVLRIIVN